MHVLSVYESSRSFIDYTLTYSKSWSDEAKRGKPVLRSDTTAVYFYVKDGTTAVLSLSDASQIEWLDVAKGQIRVKLGSNTNNKAGTFTYELRVKLASADYITVEQGQIIIMNSIVDMP